jgi:anti-sigma regulatory factor (Ser/Thr protein kinase)
MASTVELACTPSSVSSARVFIGGVLGDGCVEASVVELAVLLVSELVTNAVVHARSAVRVTVHVDAHWVRVEVEDEGTGRPLVRPFTRDQLNGRGLGVVDRLATDWGAERRAHCKVVWFEIAR